MKLTEPLQNYLQLRLNRRHLQTEIIGTALADLANKDCIKEMPILSGHSGTF